jgi:hypothetical protein
MWEELEEIRQPVELIKQWFEKPNEKTAAIAGSAPRHGTS